MAETDVDEKYITEEQPWWANDYLIFLLTIANIAIIVYDLEYFSERTIFDIIQDKDLKWMFLAFSDLLLICIFLADLRDDYDRCTDKEWWWKTHWWEFLGLIPMFVTAIPFLASLGGLRLLRLVRAFSGVLRLIGMARRKNKVTVEKQMLHLLTIVLTLIVAGGFFVYIFESQEYDALCTTVNEFGQKIELSNMPGECDRMINSFGDAMWWAIVTTTTVGYGDYSPVDPLSRIVAAFLMLVGIGLVGSLAATMSQLFYTMKEGTGGRSLVNTDEDVLSILERLLTHYENGLLDKKTYDSALSLAMKRIRAEIIMLRNEYETISSTMPVPLQVAQKIEYNDNISTLEDMLHDVESMISEEE
ncbi:MAG: Cyclic nucleotide-gated potassium channel [Methanobacteriota archaeon]|nr:MAG: Cyclic nucleotide-gated potassium channel [Euryarchaeota archaeon]